MSQPVWSLSVDLQTKTATFQSGLSDAARAARNAFTDIKQGSEGMSDGVSYNMTEARHGVMLLGEEFGVKMPRALVSFISQLGPVSAAMEAAFPFLAIIVGATLLLEHLAKLREAGEKLTESQVNFGTATANVLNSLNDKLLKAGIRADELNQNHLAALHKQLELIDHTSMDELVQAFGTISKAADELFKQMEKHWYQFGSGSAGAKSSLERFKVEYDSLLAKRDNAGANKLLDETIAREQKILDLQKQQAATITESWKGGQKGDYNKNVEATNALKAMGAQWDKDAIAAQEVLVKTLRDQYQAQQAIHQLAAGEKDNARTDTGNKIGADADKRFRAEAEAQKQALEEEQKAWEENYKRAVSDLQEAERMKIDATAQGSRERLTAIDAAIKEEQSKGLQDTGFYKGLLTARVQTTKQMDDEQTKLRAEAGKEAAEHELRMGELSVALQRTQDQLLLSAMRNSEQARLASAMRLADAEFAIKRDALQKQGVALDRSDKEYENKLKALNDRQLELDRAHENQVTALKVRAEEDRNARLLAAARRRDDAISSSLTSVLMRQESFSKAMIGLGDQVASGMIQNAMKAILAHDMTKPHDAARAAREMFLAGTHFPFPTNLVMAPLLGAAAFATVMGYERGGIVPGVGNGDIVPARLEPGEAVLPKRMTENLNKASADGASGHTYNIHVHHSPTVQALDADGMKRVLDKHADTLADHVKYQIRKMNR